VNGRTERPVFLAAGKEHAFGVFAEPTGDRAAVSVLILSGGGPIPGSVGRNSVWVRASRALASRGFTVLRVDYLGTGESGGSVDRFLLDSPDLDTIRGALDWLHERGAESVIVMGACFGARGALAVSADDRIAGCILLSLPLVTSAKAVRRSVWKLARRGLRVRTVKQMLSRRRRERYRELLWAKARTMRPRQGGAGSQHEMRPAPWVIQAIDRLVTRGAPLALVHGTGDEDYRELLAARAGTLGPHIESGAIDVLPVAGRLHTFPDARVSDAAIAQSLAWLEGLVSAPTDAAAGGR
jgi:alpha/beta superfamily hydrolase